jgi:hypothetical protein
MSEAITRPRTPVAIAAGLILWRDERMALHHEGTWPERLTISLYSLAELRKNGTGSHAYIAGVHLVVRSVEGSAVYAPDGESWQRIA